ncbi:hypothetical protein EMIT0P258_40082 [Pseudomonas sp. IT-P258]
MPASWSGGVFGKVLVDTGIGAVVSDMLRTWTVMTTLLGTLGFCITLLIWPFV